MKFTYEEEIQIANSLECVYKLRIIKSVNAPYTFYCCCDIGKILKIKQISSSFRYFNDSEKKIIRHETTSGIQDILFITIYGLIKFLSKSRKPESINFSKILNINLHQHKFTCIESDTINQIMKVFGDENIILQYPVDKYKIDLYFLDYKIAIECDEKYHNLQLEDDEIRQNKIIELLDCEFIRYSPEDCNYDIFLVINKIFKIIKTRLLEKK